MTPGDPFGLNGQVLDGQFRVDQFVGEGGFSIVYRGHHVGLDEPIAIKCLKLPNALGSALVESFVRRFRDESRLHYRLSQGNLAIARSIASGTTMSPSTSALVPYMVLEWLEGKSMAQDFEVRRQQGHKGRSLEETVKLLDSAAQALAYAHAQGVVHRDVNPGNLFIAITRHGTQLKVLDFGVAKIVSDHALEMGPRAQTIGQIRIFAPAYGAPEQFDDSMGKVGAQTDVYSFAMIVLEALRDKPVREGEHLGEFAIKALDTHLPTPRALGVAVGDEVEAVFTRAVALKVADRPADVGEFWGSLKHAMREDAASGRPAYAHPASVVDADRWKPQPPAAGGRPVTADMPAAPAVEVTRPGSVAPTPANPGNRQLHMTVRMSNAPSRPGEGPEPSHSGMNPALAGTLPLKSTLVMGNRPNTPVPATTRTGQMPVQVPPAPPTPNVVVDSASRQVAASPWAPTIQATQEGSYSGPHPSPPQTSMPNASRTPVPPPAYGAPPGAAYGAPSGGAYGAPSGGAYGAPPPGYGPPPDPSSLSMRDAPTVVPPKPASRGGLVGVLIALTIVVFAAAAFGVYRVVTAKGPDGPRGSASAVASASAPPVAPVVTAPAPETNSAAVAVAPQEAVADAGALPSLPPSPSAPSGAQVAPRATHGGGASFVTTPTTPAPSGGLTAPLDPKAFNPVAAKQSLDTIDGILASCRHPGGKTGLGHITVTFGNDGQVAHAVVDEPPFSGTPEGSCVASRMKLARIKPFEGPQGILVYEFHIPK